MFKFLFFSGQMFLMDRFFDGAFLTFGLEVIAFAERDQVQKANAFSIKKSYFILLVLLQKLTRFLLKLLCFQIIRMMVLKQKADWVFY
jgi:hypothetical protein